MANDQKVRVVVSSEAGRTEREFGAWSQFDRVVIGRSAEAGLFINDPSISRVHCKLYRDGDALWVKDLESRTGTFIDGERVTRPTRLNPGQRLTLGKVQVDVAWGASVAVLDRRGTPTREPGPVEVEGRAGGGDGANDRGRHSSDTSVPRGSNSRGSSEAEAYEASRLKAEQPFGTSRVPTGAGDLRAGRVNSSEGALGANPNNFWVGNRGRKGERGTAGIVRPRDSRRMPSATEMFDVVLDGEVIHLGRDPANDLAFPNELMISGRHAKLTRMAGTWAIQDLGSTTGTFLNGERLLRPATLDPGDLISIGPYQFTYTGDSLSTQSHHGASLIEVRGVAVPGRGKDLVLRDVSFAINSGELVGLLGISGSGKTRLMHAMCGRAPIVDGQVRYDGRDFASNKEAFRSSIGYVPSWLTLHDSLSVADGLRYASRLRLADDASASEVEGNIDRVLQELRIAERKHAPLKTLSDGQKRRVGLAVELLGSPQVMLLDEVTTALDLPTHCQFMKLFRELADSGKSLLLISHHLEDMELCDKWLYLIGGRVAFFGTPKQFCGYFGVNSLREQLEAQANSKTDGDEWARRFVNSYGPPIFAPLDKSAPKQAQATARPGRRWKTIVRQSSLLTARYRTILKADRKNLVIMLSLAPVIAGIMMLLHISLQSSVDDARELYVAAQSNWTALMKWCSSELAQSNLLVFMLVMSTIIVGTFMSVREIVKENDIVRHERFAGKDYIAYLISKIGPLSVLAVASSVGIALLVRFLGGSNAIDASVGPLLTLVGATALSSVLLGLLISAVVDSSEKAFLILAPVLIVQLTLSGALIPLPGFLDQIAKVVVIGYYPFAGIASLIPAFEANMADADAFLAKYEKPEELMLERTVPWIEATVYTLLHGFVYMVVTYLLLVKRDGYPMVSALGREFRTLGLLPGRTDAK